MKKKVTYKAILTKTRKGYIVTFPDFPGAITQGVSLEEAIRNGKDALEETLCSYKALNHTVPIPGANKRFEVPVEVEVEVVPEQEKPQTKKATKKKVISGWNVD